MAYKAHLHFPVKMIIIIPLHGTEFQSAFLSRLRFTFPISCFPQLNSPAVLPFSPPGTSTAQPMDTTAESLLLKLQSSKDLSRIYNQFAEYLQPFKPHLEPKKSSSKSTKTFDSTTSRSLAKQFLPFINKLLSLLPKRITSEAELQSPDRMSHDTVLELFSTYRLCLSCLEVMASQLSCKPYMVQVQRLRFIHRLEDWKLYEEAEVEGFSVLESLKEINFGAKVGKSKTSLVPKLNKDNRDQDFAMLILEIVVTLVKCASMNQSKEEASYRRILVLVDEAAPWFKILDASAHEKLQRVLVSYVNKIALFMVKGIASFSKTLVLKFFELSFSEFEKSSIKDQMYKFALRACSCIFSENNSVFLSTIDVLQCIISSAAALCKVGDKNAVLEFLELICYCANSCQAATSTVCCAVAELLGRLADSQVILPIGPIMRLYATGLLFFSFNGKLQNCESTTDMHTEDASGSQMFCDFERLVQQIPISIYLLKDFFAIGGKVNGLSENGAASLPSYYKALEFLCQPLAEFVYAKRREILCERDGASFISNLVIAQEALYEFGHFHYHSIAGNRNLLMKNGSGGSPKTVIHIAVANFTIALRTRRYIEESTNLLNYLISDDGVQDNALKHLFAVLYNIAIVLYRNKKMKEASEALKLSCKASWNRLVYHCKSNESHGDAKTDSSSEFANAAKDFINESCEKTVFLLDLLYEESRPEISIVLKDSLEKWSIAENIAKSLPPPYLLVKRWVKIGYKLLQDGDVDERVSTLYSLLSSSVNMSRRALGILLEQELMAYKAMNSLNPKVCQKMRMEVIDTLLEKVYFSSDSCVHKSRILIAKGGELRASGVDKLEECIQHLSEAISTLGEVCSENTTCSSLAHHLMASAHCLRALCLHESVPLNPKKSFEDIQNAINLWLCPYACHSGSQSTTMLESMLQLLHDDDWSNIMVKETLKLVCDVLDFLSIKGFTEIQPKTFDVLIRLCKWKKLPVEEVLTMLWGSRKLRHFLCDSPIHELFISKLSEHYGEICNCSRFWMKCMELSRPLLVGFQQSFLSSLAEYLHGSFCHGSLYGRTDDAPADSDLVGLVSVDEVKLVASDLISNVPTSMTSVFLSAFLYYDLSDQLILKGQVVQALISAKESHRLRSQLFQQTFKWSVDQETNCNWESADGTQKHCYAIGSFHLHDRVAYEAWGSGLPGDFDCGILSPWMVLQCYLESILQVGMLQEILGNGIEAETLLTWGKTVAIHQCLPLYVICFSNLLGKIYCKKMLWELAEVELKFSTQILTENMEIISCLKCRMFLEISISQQRGDLFKIRSCGSTRNLSMEMVSRAGELYLSVLRRLHLSVKNSLCSSEEDMTIQAGRSYVFKCKMDQSNSEEIPSGIEKSNVKGKPKGCRKTKKEKAPSTNGLRMTRSRSRALGNNCGTISGNAESCSTENSKGGRMYSETYAVKQIGNACESNPSLVDCTYEVTRLCNKMMCWHCLALQVVNTMSLDALVHMKWELISRRLSLVLLVSIGECLTVLSENHKAHHILLLSTSILLNPFCPKYSSLPHNFVVDLIGKDILVGVLAIEQAVLLYNISQISLESYCCNVTRETSCLFSCIGIPKIVSWLKLAFVLCSEVPLLFQKVSRLLTIIHVLSTSVTAFSLSSETALSESHWAAFFHQASIGNNVNQLLFSCLLQKGNSKDTGDYQGNYLSCSNFVSSSMHHSLRVLDKSQELDEVVLRFYQRLPSSIVLCISMFQGSDAHLLSALLNCPAQCWILLCRLNSSNQPILVLLPIDSVLDESSVGTVYSNTSISYDGKVPVKHWHCPWVSSVVDEAAPIFKVILKENYVSSSTYPEEDTKQNRVLWWSQRERLDQLLGEFLRGLEDSWLGPWKYLLLGHLSDNSHLSSLERNLMDELRLKCEVTVSNDLLKAILVGAMYASEIQEHGLQLILNKGCFIGGSCKDLSNSSPKIRCLSMDVFRMVLEGEHAIEDIEQLTKKPVILVLDSDIQMLPWESLPILRSEEVYRMPSVACICATLQRLHDHQELRSRGTEVFPLIDPLDCFYLLNPSGDLIRTQVEFESWFRDHNFEGKSGAAPKVEELVGALKNHDLFIYFGHGSGAQYIPGREIEKLEGCAATLLMGCSSGCLSMNGCYPQGAPLSYLLAGSPVIVANLWEVTDKDIDRFGKAVLDAWLKERSNSTRCGECDMLLDEFESMKISVKKGKGKEKRLKNKSHSASSDVNNACTNCCNHRPKVGFFMGQAREACNLPFLIGAAPVCYGVPTGITKKKEL